MTKTPRARELADSALPDLAIEARGLRKVYAASKGSPAKEALKGIDLAIPRGSFFGLLGPNGAGKSTFINIMAGLVNKTAGTMNVWGWNIDENPRNARVSIGVVPQELNIDAYFTPREAVEYQAGLYGVPKAERRTDEILAAVHLTDKADAYARTLSGGMRRRLLVAKAMVHTPPVLVLDEPTAGVDIELRQQLWNYVKGLNESGVTVLLTTHYLEEAEQLCDRVAVINHGEVVACDETRTLLSRLDRKGLSVIVNEDIDAVPEALKPFAAELMPYRRINLNFRPSRTPIAQVLAAIAASGLTIQDLSTEEPDLEDAFLALIHPEDEGAAGQR